LKKILIIEDEANIANVVKAYLEREGFEASIAKTGEKALRLIRDGYNLIILDLMLPDLDGESICAAVREISDIPILMLTAKSSENDRVKGLGMGADDYIVKPFSARELVARVKAHLRRTKKIEERILSFNNGLLKIDTQSMEVIKGASRFALTPTEFKILITLAERPQNVFSRSQLVNIVQGFDFEGYDRVIDAHMKNIRHKIEDDSQKPAFLKTVYGAGYRFIGTPDLS
jgi:DNA-binding response OmpR family regulator